MARVELRFVEIEQRLNEQRVIVEECRDCGVAVAVSAQQLAVPQYMLVEDEFRRAPRRLRIARLVQEPRRLGEGRNHQAVPCRENLVVEMRPRPLGARLQQASAQADPGLRSHWSKARAPAK